MSTQCQYQLNNIHRTFILWYFLCHAHSHAGNRWAKTLWEVSRTPILFTGTYCYPMTLTISLFTGDPVPITLAQPNARLVVLRRGRVGACNLRTAVGCL